MPLFPTAILLAAVPVTAAIGQNYNFAVSSQASSVETALGVSAPLAGTFIGDYDPKTNPGGTKTLPGLFGGSGNNPIPYSATLAIAGDVEAPPAGAFELSIDLETSLVAVNGLDLDLLGGDSFDVGATLTILYQTFRTQQPTALFPGGIPLPLPLGTIAQITSLTAVQSGPGTGVLVEQSPGIYSFTALVPVDLGVVIVIQGEPAGDGTPIPGVLPLVGTLDLTGPNAVLTATADSAAGETIDIDPPFAFDSLPLALPTVLPPGGTANLLFSGSLPSLTFDFSSDVTLVAIGERSCIPADLNCDGLVNGADLGILLAAWGGRGPADLSGDGVVDGSDLGILLGDWTG